MKTRPYGSKEGAGALQEVVRAGSELAASATKRLDSLLGHYSCQPVME